MFLQRMKLGGPSAQPAPPMRYHEGSVDRWSLQTCSQPAEDLSLAHGGALMCLRCGFCASACSKVKRFLPI